LEKGSQGGTYGLNAEANEGNLLIAEESAEEYHRNEAFPLHLAADKKGESNVQKEVGPQTRKQPTDAENQLWQALRNRQVAGQKFRRQHAIGQFIVDFVCLETSLIIEVDGGVHSEDSQAEYDQGRTQELESLGYRIIRFSNEDILQRLPQVLMTIEQATLPTTQTT
jgi:very-short-patch-repair endonuclease